MSFFLRLTLIESEGSDRASMTHSISLNTREKEAMVKHRTEQDNGTGVDQRGGVR